MEKLKEKTGQSLEVFFLNNDGTLNYRKMVETIDRMIAEEILSPLKHLDPKEHRNRKGNHPAKNTLDDFRNREPKKIETPVNETAIAPNNTEEFAGMRIDAGDEFDELFGCS